MTDILDFNPVRALDNNGASAAGAKAYFFVAGTTTPVVVKQADGDNHPVPLVADADGVFPEAFFDGGGDIKAVIYDAADVLLYEIEKIKRATSLGTSTPEFITPTLFGAVADGVANDSAALTAFLEAAKDATAALFAQGRYGSTAISITDLDDLTITGNSGAVMDRLAGTTNLLTLTDASNTIARDISLNGQYADTTQSGHGLVLIDPAVVRLDKLRTFDFGGLETDNGGAGLLVYASDPATPAREVLVHGGRFTGATSGKSFGVILADMEYGQISNSFAQNMSHWALELKQNARFNVVSDNRGRFNRWTIGQGFTNPTNGGSQNIYTGNVSADSDAGFFASKGKHILVNGHISHADTHPDIDADGNCYGIHFEVDQTDSTALGVLVTGSAINYPARSRGVRNTIEVFDFSDSNRAAVLDASASDNHIIIGGIGLKGGNLVSDIRGFLEDADTTPIRKGPGCHIWDSPKTRQWYGSPSDRMTWGLDGLENTYAHLSTTSFCFEGFDGETMLGLGVKNNEISGIRIETDTDGDEAEFFYDYNAGASQSYFGMKIEGTRRLRFDASKIAPVDGEDIDLGQDTNPFTDAFLDQVRFTPLAATPTTTGDGAVAFSDGTSSTGGFGTGGAGLYQRVAGAWVKL